MKKRLNLLMAMIALVLAFTQALAAPVMDANHQLAALLSNFKTFSANFNQQVFDENQKVVQSNTGQVLIERPGKFRWVSTVPTKQIIIASGPTLWTYDVDLEQATKQPFTESKGVTPANLLSGNIVDMQKQFNITKLPAKGDGVSFRLVPKAKSDLFQSVDMGFQNKQMTSMLVKNNLGQTIVFDFSNIVLNKLIDASQFQFSAPKGVDVINNG